jgi:hypothetical protein
MGINAANETFQSGIGSQPYTASMVTPFAQQSIDAFNNMTGLANQFQPGMTAGMQGVTGLTGENGLNQLQDQSVAGFQQMAADPSGLNAMQQQQANWLNPIASGGQMSGNPYLDEVIKRSSADITGANQLLASGAGRYGSGGHQGVTDKAIADMSAPLRYTDYATQQQRMDQAIKDYGALGTTGFGQRREVLGDVFNAGQQQWGNIANLPGQLAAGYNTAMMPSQTLRTVGGEYEDLMSKNITDQRRIFDERQAQPWSQIAKLNAIMGGTGALGSQKQEISTAPGTSRLMSGLGGAIGGGSVLGPWGALAGGLAGAFG